MKNTKWEEVNIKAKMKRTSPITTTFTTIAKQRNAAQTAIDLLRLLAIPQIIINPIDEAVTTLSGESVAIYINYLPASTEELQGLRTSDVRRVEYLDFPNDPRFHGNEHVVNFILQKYEYGGYTKASVSENILIGLSSRASIYSKFAYKKMNYDLYVGANNYNNKHIGNSIFGTYHLKDDDGNPITVQRNQLLNKAKFKENSYPVSFRAIYDSDKIQISNTLGFSFTQHPMGTTQGLLEYFPYSEHNYSYSPSKTEVNRLYAWRGN